MIQSQYYGFGIDIVIWRMAMNTNFKFRFTQARKKIHKKTEVEYIHMHWASIKYLVFIV